MNSKKGIGPVVANALLLIVVVVAVVNFQSWFQTYSSNLMADVEIQSQSNCLITVEGLIGTELYLKSNCEQKLQYLKLSDENGNELCEFKAVNDEGLVLWLPFLGNSLLSRLEDKSFNTITGNLTNNGLGTSFNNGGPTRSYINFNGNSMLEITDDSLFENIPEVTIEMWVDINSILNTAGTDNMFFHNGIYNLNIDKNSPQPYRFIYNWGNLVSYDANNYDWIHIIGMFNGTHNILYLNSSQVDININSGMIGSHIDSAKIGLNLNASLANIKIYQRALTLEEVNNSYVNPQMYLEKGINLLNLERGNCKLNKNNLINIFGFSKNGKFEEQEMIK